MRLQQPYRRLYHRANTITRGKGEEILRVMMFVVMGGSASIVNLACTKLFDVLWYNYLPPWLLIMMATEVSLLFNFVLNDRFTFRSLSHGSTRSWIQRCIRFHGPASIGFTLTVLISTSVHEFANLSLTVSQAIAIGIVMFVNFTLHRFWTFRPTKTKPATVAHL
jgi:putative flippase GtrA